MCFYFQFIILSCFVLGSLSIVYTSLRLGISPTPSSGRAKQAILKLATLYTKKPGTLLELGAGWGTLAFPLSRLHPNQQVIAYEWSFVPWAWMGIWKTFKKHPQLHIQRKNFQTVAFDEYDDVNLVVCYLFTGGMKQLQSKFERELSPGTIIISNTFSLPSWKPMQTVVLEDLYRTSIYVYKIPENS